MNTLSQRIREAMDEKPCIAADVARAAGVKEASVSDWVNDVTKTLKAEPALRAAQFLGVSPFWLVLGRGPKKPSDIERHISELVAQQENVSHESDNIHPLSNQKLTDDEQVILSAFRRADKQTKAFLIDSAVALLNRLDGFGSGNETQPGHDEKKSG